VGNRALECWRGVLPPTGLARAAQGSEARRRAVTALGEALYTHMRACHVVPAACVAMAAVAGTCADLPLPPAMLDGAPLHPVALSGPTPPGQGAPADAAPATAAHIALQVAPGQGGAEAADAYPASAWRPLAEVSHMAEVCSEATLGLFHLDAHHHEDPTRQLCCCKIQSMTSFRSWAHIDAPY
jgi:hypothetical protein